MLWQDEYTCNNLLQDRRELIETHKKETDEKIKEKLENKLSKNNKSNKYWAELLVKQYVYKESEDKSIGDIAGTFMRMVTDGKITEYIKEIIQDTDEKYINKLIDKCSKTIGNIVERKPGRTFFNDSPVIIYKSEIKALKEAGEKYAQPKDGRKQPSEWVQKYLFVWLVWQKAYNNRYDVNLEWAMDKEGDLREYAEKVADSGQRCNRFKKLINDRFISYNLKPALNLHNDFPRLFYKINFLVNEGEEAFRITDFQYIWEHYIVHNESEKYGFCSNCGEFIQKKHKDKRLCQKCQKS